MFVKFYICHSLVRQTQPYKSWKRFHQDATNLGKAILTYYSKMKHKHLANNYE